MPVIGLKMCLMTEELPGIEPRQFELKWMSHEDWQAEKAFMNAAERKMFIHHGLGWLVKFLDDARESREKAERKTISELTTLFDEGKLEGNHFICYPTPSHRESDSRGYITRTEIGHYSKLRKEVEKRKWEMLWKTK